MARKRKTIEVKKLLDWANDMLANENLSSDEHSGVCHFIENVLHESGNYAGFNHVYWMNGGFKAWEAAGEPGFPEKNKYIVGPSGDEYARFYYHAIGLK
jgi:rhodanese-related sulfurtransferase